ncbi:AAA family ATPase [bacterium]|nr:AAA family ATPase [Gammaproteobacteria bacterium]MDC1238218.1 AAA family ATPase [Pseudomonadales bacterium]MDC3304855.1 AAA family ATPase [bacterium]
MTSIYNDYFGLKESPFSIAPNPQYLYMSDRHREALAHLMYGIQGDGAFILLSGEVGTGKTTICRCLLEQIPTQVDTAFILNPKLTAAELLAAACDDLKISYPQGATIKVLTDCINAYLLEAHANDRRTVLIIDEAQNLSIEVLEQLRLLTNLETNQRKLLQIILLGQPELLVLLAKPELRQLSQRITARFHLNALNRDEISAYIKHRLVVAGAKGTFFTKPAIDRIYKISQGIPRIINLVCDRSLLGTYSEGELQVTPKIVAKAASEILGPETQASPNWRLIAIASIGSLVVLTGLLILMLTGESEAPIAQIQPTAQQETVATINQPMTAREDQFADATAYVAPAPQQSLEIAEPVRLQTFEEPQPAPYGDQSSTNLTSLRLIRGHDIAGAALNDLLQLWGVDFTDPDSASCELAETIGLFCFSSIAGLNEMNDFDRPVVINLNNQWFTLIELDRGSASLKVDNTIHSVPVAELLDAWSGNFTLLWRAPPGYKAPISIGDRGPAVDWLVNRLQVINDRTGPTTPGYVFDGELEVQVKQFQLTTGLTPDGIAGVKTWIKINDADDIETPRLDGESL